MRVPCCSVCHGRYDEGERTPLLLHCGHGFCRSCLSRMFAASTDTTLPCPRCRHPTVVGNSVLALRKNFPVLSLLASTPSFECDFSDEDDDEDEDDDGGDGEDGDGDGGYDGYFSGGRGRRWRQEDEDDYFGSRGRRRGSYRSRASVSGCCSGAGVGGGRGSASGIDLGIHHNIKFVRKIGEGRRPGHEMWTAVLSGSSSASSVSSSSSSSVRCRHRVAVKKVEVTEDMDVGWVQAKLESLRRASMWCRNVCTFHGAIRMDNHLCLIMDRYDGSILSEMQQNNGRLTLEQILRFQPVLPRPFESFVFEW